MQTTGSLTLNDTCELHCDEIMIGARNLSIISNSNNNSFSQQPSAMKHTMNNNNNQAAIGTKYAPLVHNHNYNNSNISISNTLFQSSGSSSIFGFNNHNTSNQIQAKTPSSKIAQLNNISSNNSNLPQKTESLLRNKMKKFINKIPTSSNSNSMNVSLPGSPLGSVRQKHSHKMVEPISNPIYNAPNSGFNSSSSTNNSFYNNVSLKASFTDKTFA